MTKQQENKAFVKMLKEFPKVFGRVSFRECLMLRAAFDYVVEEVIADIKANCDLAIEGRDIKIMELEDHLAEEVELHLHAEEYIKSLEQQIEEMINEIDKTMCLSNMREREIYDIQEIFRKYDFRRDSNNKWEIKENE